MSECEHVWRFYRAVWSYEVMARCAVKGCDESLDGDEVTRRLNEYTALKRENDRLRTKLRFYGRQISEDSLWEDTLLTAEKQP